jgi:zinc protease
VLGVVPAGAVGRVVADVLRARVLADLEQQGVSGVAPATTLERITADEALLTVTVPVPDGAQKVVTAALLGAVERAARDGAGGAVVGRAAEGPGGAPADGVERLVLAAEALLLAGGDPDAAGLADSDTPTTTPGSGTPVGAAALSYLLGALAAVPFGSGEVSAPWQPEPSSRLEPFSDRWFHPVEAPDDPRQLSLDAGGVSLWAPPGTHVTVPVAATAAVLRWPDGRRLLLGADGAEIDVEPTMWVGGAAVVAAVDSLWPDDLVVDRPVRPAADVPQPDRAPGEDPRLLPVTATQGFRRMAVVAAVCALGCLGVTVVFGAGQELFGALMVSICAVTMSSSTFRSINVRQGMGLRRVNPGSNRRRWPM